MWAKIGLKVKAAFAATLAALAISCGDELEVRTFELQRLAATEAAALVSPFVFDEREGAPGTLSITETVLTVREMPENLDRIAEVLARYDRAAAEGQLRFQLIEANGYSDTDPAIADVQAELQDLLRYDGYRLVGEAVLNVREGEWATQKIDRLRDAGAQEEPPFELNVEMTRVTIGESGSTAEIAVSLSHPWYQELFETKVTVGDGKSMVLGTTSAGMAEAEALILVLRPTITRPSR